MDEASYSENDVRESFRMSHELVSSAIQELDRSPEHAEASGTLRRGLARIEAAGKALVAGDPTEAERDLSDAEGMASEALAAAKRSNAAMPAGNADLSFDLIDQARSAIERAAHRVRNTVGRHTTFGAIRTPLSERCP